MTTDPQPESEPSVGSTNPAEPPIETANAPASSHITPKMAKRHSVGTSESDDATDDDSRSIFASFSGPLPPPKWLAEYEHVHPGLGGMIATLMIDEAKDRRALRKAALDAEIEDAKAARSERSRGQTFGLIIGLFAITIGAVVSICGHGGAGAFIGGGGVVGLVTVFITGRAIEATRSFDSSHSNHTGSSKARQNERVLEEKLPTDNDENA